MAILTDITPKRAITRRTGQMIRDGGKVRSIVVQLFPGYMLLRGEASSKKYPISYSAVYELAAANAAERLRKERKEKLKAKREGRA